MIDGFKITCEIANFEAWADQAGLDFKMRVSVTGGEQVNYVKRNLNQISCVTKYFTSFGSYKLLVVKTEIGSSLSQIETTKYRLFVRGSFHKNYYRSQQHPNGANYQQFTFDQFQDELVYLKEKLCIDLTKAKLQYIEFGVNLPVDFNVMENLEKNLLLYKNKLFERWGESRGVSIGYQCKLNLFSVKIYDKALQFDLPSPLMRFEIRVNKMLKVKKYQIKYLSDLQVKANVARLLDELLYTWNHILLYDESLDNKEISTEDRTFLTQCCNINYWRSLKKGEYSYFLASRAKFISIHQNHNSDLKSELIQKITLEWTLLLSENPLSRIY